MSSTVCEAHRYCWPRLAKLPVSGNTEPMRTSVTFGWAGAIRNRPKAATTTTAAKTIRRREPLRMRDLQTRRVSSDSSGPLSYQIDGRHDLARDPAGWEAPGREVGQLRDRQIAAGHHDRDVARLLHHGQQVGGLGDPGRPLARRRAQPPRLPGRPRHAR